MKLKGIELNGTYKVEFYDERLEVYDDKGNRIYYEDSDGYWTKSEYDERDNQLYYENSDGGWYKSEHDERDNQLYYENSNGEFIDNRVKELQNSMVKAKKELITIEATKDDYVPPLDDLIATEKKWVKYLESELKNAKRLEKLRKRQEKEKEQ